MLVAAGAGVVAAWLPAAEPVVSTCSRPSPTEPSISSVTPFFEGDHSHEHHHRFPTDNCHLERARSTGFHRCVDSSASWRDRRAIATSPTCCSACRSGPYWFTVVVTGVAVAGSMLGRRPARRSDAVGDVVRDHAPSPTRTRRRRTCSSIRTSRSPRWRPTHRGKRVGSAPLDVYVNGISLARARVPHGAFPGRSGDLPPPRVTVLSRRSSSPTPDSTPDMSTDSFG
jgi:hypothetical protein